MQSLSLYELNGLVREAIEAQLPDALWVRAELSSVHVNGAGHCYLELVQKHPSGAGLIAKARAVVWASRWRMLQSFFEQTTGQAFAAGISVLLNVTVEYHELYGLTLVVEDIDPAYTLGDMAQRRREILQQLEKEGTIGLNKELTFPLVPKRVAVISSETAAGYGDFCHQLATNTYGFMFQLKLFPAVMQGDAVEPTIIHALDAIAAEQEQWDVVVIIRGGGATSDLVGFDTYELAANCAQFPLPILTGIGHERDTTVLDAVAHTSVKTPTAAAEFLINRMAVTAEHLDDLASTLAADITLRLQTEDQRLQSLTMRLPAAIALRTASAENTITLCVQRLHTAVALHKASAESAISLYEQRLHTATTTLLAAQHHRLDIASKVLANASPDVVLRRGYTLTRTADGHVVTSASTLSAGDILITRFAEGEAKSTVTK